MTYHAMLRAQQEIFDIMPDSKIGMEMAEAFEEAERFDVAFTALKELHEAYSDGLCNCGIPGFDSMRLPRAIDAAEEAIERLERKQ